MMRKFKHRTLGWIAEEKYGIFQYNTGDLTLSIHKKLIENSQDREEVIEKDWIDNCIFDIHKWCKDSKYRKTPRHIIRREIEQHAPKQVKFTKTDIQEWYNNYPSMDGTKMVRDFLKQHNLLAEEQQGETSE